MARTRWLGPIDPIFDDTRREGAIAVGNTPGVDYTYDYVLVVVVGGVIWFICCPVVTAPVWESLADAMVGDIRNEETGANDFSGLEYFLAWYAESGNAPVTYEDAVTLLDLIWYSVFETTDTPVWESLAVAQSNDIRNEVDTGDYNGLQYFQAWWAESGNAPATYDDAIAETTPIWFSHLAELDTTGNDGAYAFGGTITTPGDGFRYHTFNVSDQFITMDPQPLAIERFGIAAGGTGGRPNAGSNYAGGGSAGEHVLDSPSLSDGYTITVAIAPTAPAAGTQGNDGPDTIFADLTGAALLTLKGGKGGGIPAVSSGAGKSASGTGNGSGAGAASGVSGAGGSGAGGGTNGGSGGGSATASQNRAGGGGGATGNGVTGVAAGATGTGGAGVSAFGTTYGGGGAGATGSGTATGGSGGGGNAGTGNGSNATANTGSGGGGAGGTGSAGLGAAGKVIIRYVFP